MREKQVRQQTFRMLRLMRYWPITQTDAAKCPGCGALLRPPIGRPDILVLHPTGQTIVTEVKAMMPDDTSLSFKCVTPEQGTWLDAWMSAGGKGYLTIGVIRPAKSRTKLARLYMVDWGVWRYIEQQFKPIQASLPLAAGKGTRKVLQERQWDILTLLKPYELERRVGRWWLPEGHSAQIEEAHSEPA